MSRIKNMIRLKMIKTMFFVCAWLVSSLAIAAPELVELHANPLGSGKLALEFGFSEPITTVDDKLEYQPTQLVLSIPNTQSSLKLNPVPIDINGVKSVETIDDGIGGIKLIIKIDDLIPYRLSNVDSKLTVTFGESPKLENSKDAPASAAVNSVLGMDFRRNENGGGQFIIDLENDSIAADIQRRGQSVIIDFHSTHIDDEQIYIMDVSDFATPVQSIEVFRDKAKVRLELKIKGHFEYHYDQVEKQFFVEVDKVKEVVKGEKVFKGKPISLNFQNIPVRTVLQIIADFNGFNLVTTDSVNGSITLRLDGVPWEQALDILLKVKGLDKRLENNVLMVAPAEELAERERQELENDKQVEELAPLHSEFLQINYAKASEIAALIQSGDSSLMTSRGQVAVDVRTNILLIKDTAVSLDNIKKMLKKLDIPIRQVVIEARMVTVQDTIGDELGIRWGISNRGAAGDAIGTTSGHLEGNDILASDPPGIPSLDQRLNVNLPVAGAAGSIALQVAKLASGRILDLELSALEKENKGEIVASPRITTANQKAAYIEQGQEIPYVESASSGATAVTFKKAVLSLQVTPQITPDNKIILDLIINQDSIGDEVATPIGRAQGINTQEISTQVLVSNGETIVLGGIYLQESVDNVTKIPLLGDIPGLGFLFRTQVRAVKKNELLIFVTPRILLENEL